MKQEKIKYKKRVKVEHFYGFIKGYQKINSVYEKTKINDKNRIHFNWDTPINKIK